MEPYPGIEKPFPKYRIVFKNGVHLNVFGAEKFSVEGAWTRLFTRDGRTFMYDPANVLYVEIRDK